MHSHALLTVLASVIIAAALLFRKLRGGGLPGSVPAEHPVGGRPAASRSRRIEPGYELIVRPSAQGYQHLCIDAGPEDTVCTLSSYSDRVALGRADPYLVIHVSAYCRAQLRDLRAGTYDVLIETGQDWDSASRAFNVPHTRRRSLRPLRLFGPHTLILTAYPVANGDFPLTDP
ncbi:hypothetical protein RKD32_000179 [Streptomyces sp. SAI-195]